MAELIEHRIRAEKTGSVAAIELEPIERWASSDFPLPFLTVDYNANGNIIQIECVEPWIPAMFAAYGRWLAGNDHNKGKLVAEIVKAITSELDRPSLQESSK